MSAARRPYQSFSLDQLVAVSDATNDTALVHAVIEELRHRKTQGAKRLSVRLSQRVGTPEPDVDLFGKRSPQPTDNARPGSTCRRQGEPSSNTGGASLHPSGGRSSADPSHRVLGPPERRANPRKPAHPPTPEQVRAIEEFMSGDRLKVSAFAGAGKTSTLVQMADIREGAGLYLAFNRSIADEARESFPSWVDCRTTHSLALRSVRAAHGYSKDKLFETVKPKQLADLLGLKNAVIGKALTVTDVQQAHLLLGTIRRFCQSADDALDRTHVLITGRLKALDDDQRTEVDEWVVFEARKLWERMLDATDKVPLGHDGYLKLWSLSDPVLEHEYILLDEAQDTNPCVMRVLERQRAQVVYVGDGHQQIYAWRGATNAMKEAKAKREAHLTQSFRFGPEIALAASSILRTLGEARPLEGNARIQSTIAASGAARTVLTRTNAMVISEVLDALEGGRVPHIVGGVEEMLRLVGSVFDLQDGKPASHPDFFGFVSWDQVEAFADTDEGEDLRPFVNLVRKYGPRTLWRALKETVPSEEAADVVLSTAHKSKGRQWPSVRIADDFAGVQSEGGEIPEEEVRLFYVAITRAQERLVIDPELLAGFSLGRLEPKKTAKRATLARPPGRTNPAHRTEPVRVVSPALANPQATPHHSVPVRPARTEPQPTVAVGSKEAKGDPNRPLIPPSPPPLKPEKRGFLARLFGR